MDGVRLQSLINRGMATSASKIGLSHAHYRPSGPLAPANALPSLPASFDANDYRYSKPSLYGKATWTALLDGARTAVGDYLVGPTGSTWFLAAEQPHLPIVAVSCNATLTLRRPHSSAAVGALPYGGDIASDEDLVASRWPASVLTKGRGDKGDVQLPGNVRTLWVEVLLPAIPAASVLFADVFTDDAGQRMKVSSAELTDMGWRLLCLVAVGRPPGA